MPNTKNIAIVEQLKTNMAGAKSVVIADYSGINVADQNKLRAEISKAGGSLNVAKNRLFKLVAKEHVSGDSSALDEALNGQNAFLFALEDAVSPLKALFDFAKDNENLKIKLGILDGRVLSYEETENLSKLPSKPELIVKLMGQLQAPAYGLVNVLSATTRNLVYALNAIKEKKEATN
jgi:large subunit ribosomal protein L10